MTCIVAIKHKGKIMIAGDRRMSWGIYQAQPKPTSKVVKRNGLLIAGTGACYLLSLARDILKFPKPTKKDKPVEYMNNKFYPCLDKLLKQKGFIKAGILSIPKEMHTEIVIGVNGSLFSVDLGNSAKEDQGLIVIDEVALPYGTGCGGQLAWGSLITTQEMGLTPRKRLELAIEAAATVSPGCDGNIDIVQED